MLLFLVSFVLYPGIPVNCVYFIMSADGQKANTDVKALPTADCKQCNIIYNIIYTVFRMLLYTAMLWSQH